MHTTAQHSESPPRSSRRFIEHAKVVQGSLSFLEIQPLELAYTGCDCKEHGGFGDRDEGRDDGVDGEEEGPLIQGLVLCQCQDGEDASVAGHGDSRCGYFPDPF